MRVSFSLLFLLVACEPTDVAPGSGSDAAADAEVVVDGSTDVERPPEGNEMRDGAMPDARVPDASTPDQGVDAAPGTDVGADAGPDPDAAADAAKIPDMAPDPDAAVGPTPIDELNHVGGRFVWTQGGRAIRQWTSSNGRLQLRGVLGGRR